MQTEPFFCPSCQFSSFCETEDSQRSDPKQLNSILKQRIRIKKRGVLCAPNHKFRSFYAVNKGTFKTFQMDQDGNELIRNFYFAGEILGFEAIYTQNYSFSAVALSDAIVCEIPYENFLDLLHHQCALQKRFIYLMSQQLNLGLCQNYTTADKRLAAFLVDLSLRLQPFTPTIYEITIPMSRQDIANYLRLTPETVSRTFSKFQKNKLIKIINKKVKFLKLKELHEIFE